MTTITRLLLCAALLFSSIFSQAQTRHYVNAAATGAGDGTSWTNAFTDLQAAFSASQYGDEVWVAQGTYYPTTTADRNISFEIPNGVKLYGGFFGNETSLTQRDWQLNETKLSGDIGSQGDVADNSYTVVYLSDVDSTTVLDGFTITDGNADKNSAGEPVTGANKSGGGAYITSNIMGFITAPMLVNCYFTANNSAWDGGAVMVFNKENFLVNPRITSCRFSGNTSRYGGAVNIYGGNDGDDLVFLDCLFEVNFARNGGAMHFYNLYGTHRLVLDSCMFDANFAEDSGGAYFQEVSNPENTKLFVNNCTFSNNSAVEGGGIASLSFTNSSFIFINKSFFISNFAETAASIRNFNDKLLSISDTWFSREIGINGTGCIYAEDISTNLFNCIFEKCRSDFGNVLDVASSDLLDTFRIINNIFLGNEISKGITTLPMLSNYVVSNSIFLGNSLSDQGKVFLSNTLSGSYSNIYNCLFDVPDNSYLMLNPAISGPGNLYNLAPLFRDTAAGDYRLLPCSPARNAGSNAIVDSLGILTDIEGSPRIQGGTVDMGAYESPDFGASDVAVIAPACGSSGLGTVSLTLAHGCPPYFLDWGTGSTISDTSLAQVELPVGTHAVTVTDGRMESDTVSVTVTAAPAIAANAVASPVNCANGTGGSASVEATGGTGGLGFQWSSGGTSASVAGLAEGTYTVTVTDASGCTAVDTVEVLAQGSLGLGLSIQPVTCPGDTDGSATVQPIGGAMPFQWLWQSGETTASIENLSGGTYAATVTDALGCTGDIDFTIELLETISIDIASTGADCFGGLGNATATATGGTGSFSYLWDTGAATAAAPLPAGPHSVTATDANGCTATATTEVTEPPALSVSATPQPMALCHGASDGSIAVSPSGGTPPYGWGGPLEGLPPGTYTATVTDANGCTATASATLGELTEIAATGTVTDASSPTALDGSIMLNSVTGGTGSGYAFLWSNGGTSQNLTGLPTGSYTVTVTDSQGCIGVFSFHVDFETATGEAAPDPFGAAIVPNPSGSTGAVLVVNRPSNDMRFTVLDALGRVVFAEQEITTDRQELPPGLAPGCYVVLLKNGGDTSVLQWVVAK